MKNELKFIFCFILKKKKILEVAVDSVGKTYTENKTKSVIFKLDNAYMQKVLHSVSSQVLHWSR